MALIYPDAWPICPDGCPDPERRGHVERLHLFLVRGGDRVRAFLTCLVCRLEEPGYMHGFRAAVAHTQASDRPRKRPEFSTLIPGAASDLMITITTPSGVWPAFFVGGHVWIPDVMDGLVVTHQMPQPAPPLLLTDGSAAEEAP